MRTTVRLAPLPVLFLLASAYSSESGVSLAARAHPDKVRIQIQDLGTLIPGGRSGALAINSRGHVVGFASIDPLDLNREGPFLWSPEGGMQSILEGTVPDLLGGVAWGLNDRDDVVGTFYTSGGDGGGFLWNRQEGLVNLGPEFFPAAINNRGQIAGVCLAPELGDEEFPGAVACLWEDGVLTRLGISLGAGSWGPQRLDQVGGINERGEAVFTGARGVAWLWSPRDGAVPLPLAIASGIANSGFIVGQSSEHTVAVLRRTAILGRAPHLFVPTAINSTRWVVGNELGEGQTSFLWRPNGIVTTLPSPTPSSYAGAINDRGQIAGNVTMEDGVIHAVVWTVHGSNSRQ